MTKTTDQGAPGDPLADYNDEFYQRVVSTPSPEVAHKQPVEGSDRPDRPTGDEGDDVLSFFDPPPVGKNEEGAEVDDPSPVDPDPIMEQGIVKDERPAPPTEEGEDSSNFYKKDDPVVGEIFGGHPPLHMHHRRLHRASRD